MKAISLFSGAGGSDIGFEQAGFDIIYSTDNDPVCNETYNKNFDSVQRPYSIQALNEMYLKGKVLKNYFKDVDVVFGGPPCQSFSLIKVRGKLSCEGLENVREMQKFVGMVQPKFFVCENVANLLRPSMLAAHMEFKQGFMKQGYEVSVYNFNAENFCIPQSRERAFYIGVRSDLYAQGLRFTCPDVNHWSKRYSGWADYLNETLDDNENRYGVYIKRACDVGGRLYNEAAFTVTGAERPCIRFNSGSLVKDNQIGGIMRQVKGVKQRYLTIGELKALQGFPKDFYFHGGIVQVRRQIGNAWCVPVGRTIAKSIASSLKKVEIVAV